MRRFESADEPSHRIEHLPPSRSGEPGLTARDDRPSPGRHLDQERNPIVRCLHRVNPCRRIATR